MGLDTVICWGEIWIKGLSGGLKNPVAVYNHQTSTQKKHD